MILTQEEIKEDIQTFEDSITQARDKLAILPQTAGTWQDRAKLKAQRQALNDDIRHVRQLITYAKEGLNGIN